MFSDRQKENSDKLTASLVVLLIFPFALAWRGYVFSCLWAWFIVPIGLDAISVTHAIGLSGIVAIFSASPKNGDDFDTKPPPAIIFTMITYSFLYPLLSLALGAIVRSLMPAG